MVILGGYFWAGSREERHGALNRDQIDLGGAGGRSSRYALSSCFKLYGRPEYLYKRMPWLHRYWASQRHRKGMTFHDMSTSPQRLQSMQLLQWIPSYLPIYLGRYLRMGHPTSVLYPNPLPPSSPPARGCSPRRGVSEWAAVSFAPYRTYHAGAARMRGRGFSGLVRYPSTPASGNPYSAPTVHKAQRAEPMRRI